MPPPFLASMADLELFGAQQQQQQPPAAAADNGALDDTDEDPAAAFLAQQENEIAGIENDEGYGILEDGEVPEDLDLSTRGGTAGPAPLPLSLVGGLAGGARRRGEGSWLGGASQLLFSLRVPVSGRGRCRRGHRLSFLPRAHGRR